MEEFLSLVLYFILSGPLVVVGLLISIAIGVVATPVLIVYALCKMDYI